MHNKRKPPVLKVLNQNLKRDEVHDCFFMLKVSRENSPSFWRSITENSVLHINEYQAWNVITYIAQQQFQLLLVKNIKTKEDFPQLSIPSKENFFRFCHHIIHEDKYELPNCSYDTLKCPHIACMPQLTCKPLHHGVYQLLDKTCKTL